MHHNDTPDEARTGAPACGRAILALPIGIQVLDIETTGEIVGEVVTRASLQGLAIAHQSFDRVGTPGACESFILALAARNNWYGSVFLGEGPVYLKHHERSLFCFFNAAVGGVTLLPQEFGCTQEEGCALLPTHNVVPLVYQDGQVTVALHPLGISVANNCLAGRTDSIWLFQFLAATARHPRHFRRESFNMFGFSLQEAAGDEQREVGIDYPRFLETCIHMMLN